MTDCYPKDVRSKVMAKIRSKNTKPEVLLRKHLWNQGYRGYRIHNTDLPGKPDIAFKKRKVAIFIDGCFWHKCPECFIEPKTNRDYWLPKIQSNIERDKKNQEALEALDWTVIRIWEHEIKNNIETTAKKIVVFL